MALVKKLRTRPVEGLKVILVAAFGLAVLGLARPTPGSFLAGLPLVVAGVWVRGWAAGHLRRNKELATSGPYAYVRDPLYLGRLFLLIGFTVMANTTATYVLGAIGLGVFFLNYMPRKLRKETARLQGVFGKTYVDYRRQVRSLVPRLTPFPGHDRRTWSPTVYWRENHEQWLLLAAAALTLVLALKIG
ncbi:MAG: isoprenylcysteine carboxylmethyltransferase family protein [Kiritimatiellaeota bacterium]|nr:isoprenylcysteine carboxylmethyltransferase family protein [Kiritimatiellota bacterium]